MGITLESSHNIPVVKILVKINIKGKTMRINILDEIPFGPLDLAGFGLIFGLQLHSILMVQTQRFNWFIWWCCISDVREKQLTK